MRLLPPEMNRLNRVYDRWSGWMIGLVLITLPVLVYLTLEIRTRTDIEEWFPGHSPELRQYQTYKQWFGAEEVVVAASPAFASEPEKAEAVARQLEELPEFSRCWTERRLVEQMREFGVPEQEARERIEGLLISRDRDTAAVAAFLSETGQTDRTLSVQRLSDVVRSNGVPQTGLLVAGVPVFVAELDRLGSKEHNVRYFVLTLALCFVFLWWILRQLDVAALFFALTVWAVNLTMALLNLVGFEMDLLLQSVSVLTMVFTLSTALHYVEYYRHLAAEQGLDGSTAVTALHAAFRPTLLSTVTTVVGVASLALSDIVPVARFAWGATCGCLIAFVAGLYLTPAVLKIAPLKVRPSRLPTGGLESAAATIVAHRGSILALFVVANVAAGWGLTWLTPRFMPDELLPDDSSSRSAVVALERNLMAIESVEAVVDFSHSDASLEERVQVVRILERELLKCRGVDHVLSAVSFVPNPLPADRVRQVVMLRKMNEKQPENDFITADLNQWRATARIKVREHGKSRTELLEELSRIDVGHPVILTGLSTLLDSSQQEIFVSFRKSVFGALLLTGLIMWLFVGSFRLAFVAMLPNITPLVIVFGVLGWADAPVDIAMMLSGSISLGMAVDGTFHFLARLFRHRADGVEPQESVRCAWCEAAAPLTFAAVTSCASIAALTLSSFAPTVRFAWLMIATLTVALAGDLWMLPTLVLAAPGWLLRTERRPETQLVPGVVPLDR